MGDGELVERGREGSNVIREFLEVVVVKVESSKVLKGRGGKKRVKQRANMMCKRKGRKKRNL